MTPQNAVAYWDRGIDLAPLMTGAATVMDCADIREVLGALGIPTPLPRVLDVGCGTGRLAQLCDAGYLGVDIAPSQVAFAMRAGVQAQVITGPDDLPVGWWEWVTCLSVFTHINRREQQRYLRAFSLRANQLLVDIIPGDGRGDVALWTTHAASFVEDIDATGWCVRPGGGYDRISPDGVLHRYVHLVRGSGA